MKRSTLGLVAIMGSLMLSPAAFSAPNPDDPQGPPPFDTPKGMAGPHHRGMGPQDPAEIEKRKAERKAVLEQWQKLPQEEKDKFIAEAKKQHNERKAQREEHRLIMLYGFYSKNPEAFEGKIKPMEGKGNQAGPGAENRMKRHFRGGKPDQETMKVLKERYEEAKKQWDALSDADKAAFKTKVEERRQRMETMRAEHQAMRLFGKTLKDNNAKP